MNASFYTKQSLVIYYSIERLNTLGGFIFPIE